MPLSHKVIAAPPTVITEGLSPAFNTVASHLELGGCSFNYSEAGGMASYAQFMDEIMQSLPASERKDLPPNFSIAKFFNLLGLDSVAATGSSSRRRADGSFHSRFFTYMPQGRKGLMTLTGGPATKLLLHEVAPKDTDLALEFSFNLKDFARDTLPQFLQFMPTKERGEFEKQLHTPAPGYELTPIQLMEKMDARIGIFLRMDPAQKFKPAPDAPVVPGLDGVIVLDRLGWVLEAMKPQLMQALSQPDAPAAASMEGGAFFIRFKGPMGPPPMDYQPVLRYDPKDDRILIASRPAIFDSVANGKDKFTDGADFAQTWRDLPTEGNACIYASTRLLQTLWKTSEQVVMSAGAKRPGSSSQEAAVMQKMFNTFKPFLSRGQAITFTNLPDGMMTMSNTSFSLGSSSLETISTVAILASVAVPAFSNIQEAANDANDINKLRQLVVCLKIYATDHGKYPAQLSDLIKEGVLDQPRLLEFSSPNSPEKQAPLYNNKLTDSSDGNAIVLATPAPTKAGKRVVAFNDGNVQAITEAEFQKRWNKE